MLAVLSVETSETVSPEQSQKPNERKPVHRFHDGDAMVPACGLISMNRKKINVSTVLAGQKLGIREVDDGIWLISFKSYDLGYIDLEQGTLRSSSTTWKKISTAVFRFPDRKSGCTFDVRSAYLFAQRNQFLTSRV
jgi:hypothetical protein